MGTPPSARVDGTIRKMSCKQSRFRGAIEAVRAHVRVAMIFSAIMNKSGQDSDEQVVELASLLEIVSKFT